MLSSVTKNLFKYLSRKLKLELSHSRKNAQSKCYMLLTLYLSFQKSTLDI